jgi:hypothetical protein
MYNISNIPQTVVIAKNNAVNVAMSGTSGTKWLLGVVIVRILERYSVRRNRMDRPSHLICHLISCPVFPAALSVSFSSLLTYHVV